MTPYEYALHNWYLPPLKEAAEICRDIEELLLLRGCLLSKGSFQRCLSIASRSITDKEKDYWLDSADFWSFHYLNELKMLEELQ